MQTTSHSEACISSMVSSKYLSTIFSEKCCNNPSNVTMEKRIDKIKSSVLALVKGEDFKLAVSAKYLSKIFDENHESAQTCQQMQKNYDGIALKVFQRQFIGSII